MKEDLIRTEMLVGAPALERLANARVAVFGLGGVGGYAVEALARSGVGALELIDHDIVARSNLNRQILATQSSIGRLKVDVAAERIRDINPDCRVTIRPLFFLPDTADQFDMASYDYIVDAIDTVTAKLLLAQKAQEAGTPLISVMGTGNKLDPTAFMISDIYNTSGCHLARIMRRECRARGIRQLKVVYSTELPQRRTAHHPATDASGKRIRDTPGSIAFVPGVAGLIASGEVIRELCGVTL